MEQSCTTDINFNHRPKTFGAVLWHNKQYRVKVLYCSLTIALIKLNRQGFIHKLKRSRFTLYIYHTTQDYCSAALILEQLFIEGGKSKTKVITLAIRKDIDNPVNQSQLEAITWSAEHLREQVTIGFGFSCDWLGTWIEIFKSITKRSSSRPSKTEITQVKIALTLLVLKGATSSFVYFEKKLAKLFKIVISNPYPSSLSLAIIVRFCFRITPMMLFFISKPVFLGFPTLLPEFRPSKKWLKIPWRSSFKSIDFWGDSEEQLFNHWLVICTS